MKRLFSYVTVLCALAAPAAAGPRLSLGEAVKRAQKHAPLVLISEAEAQEAEAEVDRNRQLDNPEFRLRSLRPADLDRETDVGLALRVPVPNPFVRSSETDKNRALAGAQKKLTEKTVQDAQARIRELYAEWWYVHERRQALAQSAAEDQAFALLQKERAQAGAATVLDQQLAEIAVMRVESEQEGIDSKLEALRTEILYWTDSPRDTEIVGSTPVPPTASFSPDTETLIKEAHRRRPDLLGQSLKLSGAAAEISAERASRVPWFSWFQVGYDIDPGPDPSPWSVSLSLELPLLSWNGGGVSRAEARRAQVVHTKRELSQAIARDVRSESERVRRRTEKVLRAQRLLSVTQSGLQSAIEAQAAHALDPDRARPILLEHRRAVEEYHLAILEWQLARIALDSRDRHSVQGVTE